MAERTPGELESTPTWFRLTAPSSIVRHEHRAIPPKGGGVLKNARVYLLVSKNTVSAGEHFALALKRTGRATLIGEPTRGAGNFGQSYGLPNNFSAFIPFGRTFDPDTGNGWEGIGVKPSVEVAAEKGLDEALKLEGLELTSESALASLT